MARLFDQYQQTIAPALAEKFGVKNKLAVPKLEKIVVNMGVGRATQDKAVLDAAVDTLGRIAGQKPVVTKAKVSVSSFRLREGNDIGCKVTLRGRRMYEFLDRLISIALPRIRDFRGVNPNSFDGNGNYTMGLAEQVVFPEIDADKITHTLGMDITFVTTAETDEQARELLRAFGMPFRQPQQARARPAAAAAGK
jgi:large subunit ribosomal protein L5